MAIVAEELLNPIRPGTSSGGLGPVAQVRVRSVDANLGYLSLHTAKRRVSIFSCPTACDAFSNPDSPTS